MKKIYLIFSLILLIGILSFVYAGSLNSSNPQNKISKNYNFYYDQSNIKFDAYGYWFSYSLDSISTQQKNKAKELKNTVLPILSNINNNEKVDYSSISTDIDLNYKLNQNELKENFVINKANKFKKTDGDLIISGNLSFDPRLQLMANGIKYNSNDSFNTSSNINFVDSTMSRFTIPSGTATDSVGNSTNLIYSYNNGIFNIIVPIDWLSDVSRVYPVYIDPSAITGCFENTTDIICNSSSGYTGNYIDTSKNITITGTYINGNTGGLIRLNTTSGFLKIINSQLLANASDQTSSDNLYLYGNLNSNISGSTIKIDSVYTYGGLSNYCYLNFINNLSISNSLFWCNGTSGTYSASASYTGGAGYIKLNASNVILTNPISTFVADGGGGWVACSGGQSQCASGGSGQINIYGNLIGNANFSSKGGGGSDCNNGGSGGLHANHGSSTITLYSSEFNLSGNMDNTAPVASSDATCTFTAGSSSFNSNTKNSTLILNSGTLTGNQNFNFQVKEFTLLNYIFSSTGTKILNLTGDIARIGLFGSSTRPSITPTYFGTIGKIIIGNSTSGLTLTGISYSQRDTTTAFQNYYGALANLTSPVNNSLSGGTTNFNFNAWDDNNLKNSTLLVYNSTGNLISSSDYVNISGTSNSSTISHTFTSNGNYTISLLTYNSQNISDGGTQNITLQVATTAPSVSIDSITTTAGSQTISFNTTATANSGSLSSCFYSVTNSTGQEDPSVPANKTFTCNSNPQSATVSAYGDYTLYFYANDTYSNLNSTSYNFTTSASSGGLIVSGGGGTTIVVGTGNWTMETSPKVKSYDKILPAGTSVTLSITFKNTGEKNQTITLSCLDINGTFCNYVNLGNTTFNLPVIKDLETVKYFKVTLPESVSAQTAIFNILGTDTDKKINSISVTISTGNQGVPLEWISKLGLNSILLGGFPYSLIGLVGLLIGLLFFGKAIPKDTPAKPFLVLIGTGFIVFMLVWFL